MNYKIIRKIEFNENASSEKIETQIFESFKVTLEKDGFRTYLENNSLIFDRKIENINRTKGAILGELVESMVSGNIKIQDKNKLVVTLNYTRQLIVSMIVGLVAAFIFGIVSDYNLKFMIISFFSLFIILFMEGYLKVYGLVIRNLKNYSR